MFLPNSLRTKIEEISSTYSHQSLKESSTHLSQVYREHQSVHQDLDRIAYLSTRMPATFASISRVLQEIPTLKIESILDLGSGPATTLWAAWELWHTRYQCPCLERDQSWINLAKQLEIQKFMDVSWEQKDLLHTNELPQHDLVVFAYSLGELPTTSTSSTKPGKPHTKRLFSSNQERLMATAKSLKHVSASFSKADTC